MRYGVPRSQSPSPDRRRSRGPSTYGLFSDSEDSEDDFTNESTLSDSSEPNSEPGSSVESDFESSFRTRLRVSQQSPEEKRKMEETITEIRRQTRYHDPYEEWEKQTRKEAFKAARKGHATEMLKSVQDRKRHRLEESQRLAAEHAKRMEEVQATLNAMRIRQQTEEAKLREAWELRQQQLWNRIESAIKAQEDKVARQLEEEKRKRDEEERKREEEERRKEEERKVEIEKRIAQERLQEEKRKKEEEARQEQEDKDRELESELQIRKRFNLSIVQREWEATRITLKEIKGSQAQVKANPELKTQLMSLRRQIRAKVGQVANDPAQINRVCQQLFEIINPLKDTKRLLYIALVSALSKAIILQAEVEIEANPDGANRYAQLVFNLLPHIPSFPEVLFTRMTQRIGGWAIPFAIPGNRDWDERPWTGQEEYREVSGYRKVEDEWETEKKYNDRVAAVMTLYFKVLMQPPSQYALNALFRPTRCWTWFARIVSKDLVARSTALRLIDVGLQIMSDEALRMWGRQWVKILYMIYDGVTTGMDGILFGGNSDEAAFLRRKVKQTLEDKVAFYNSGST